MSKRSPRKQNNRSFHESFNHVEPPAYSGIPLIESFNHVEPPAYSGIPLIESFDA